MAFVTPTAESVATATGSQPNLPGQAVLDQTDIAIMVAGIEQTGVISGCGVTATTASGSLAVTAASGIYSISGISYSFSGGTINTGWTSSAYDRRDLITINSSGALALVTGTPTTGANWFSAASFYPPVKPAIPSGSVVLAEVYVPGTITSLAQSDIVDKTFPIAQSFVGSFNGRQGAVVPAVADYTAQMITNASVAYNVKNYGAVGNGTTVDTTAIAAAITAAGIGGSVYFPTSTGPFMASGLTPLSGQTWFGPGTLKLVPSSSSPLITGTAVSGWTCGGGLTLDGNRSNALANSTGLVYLISPTGCNLVDAIIQNTQGVSGSASTCAVMFRMPQNCGVVQCDFSNCGSGIMMGSQYTDHTIMNGNVVLNCTFNTTDNDTVLLTDNFGLVTTGGTTISTVSATQYTVTINAPGTWVKGGSIQFSSLPTGIVGAINTLTAYQIITGGTNSFTISVPGVIGTSGTGGAFSWTNNLLHGTIISGCAITNTGDCGVEVGSGCLGTVVSGVSVDNTAVPSVGNHAFLVRDAQNTTISAPSGLGFTKASTSSLVHLATLNVVPQGISISGPIAQACNSGIYDAAASVGLNVTGGVISGCNGSGASAISLQNGTSQASIRGVTVLGGSSTASAGIYVGQTGACHDITITGCTVMNSSSADGIVINNGSYDVIVNSNRAGGNQCGFLILDTASYNVMCTGNNFIGNYVAAVTNNSTAHTNVIQNNLGALPQEIVNPPVGTSLGSGLQVNGMAANATVILQCTGAGQLSIYIGPAATTANLIAAVPSATVGQVFCFPLPVGWYITVTTTNAANYSIQVIATQ